MKIVINKCFGGFSISKKAAIRCYELGMKSITTPVGEYYGLVGKYIERFSGEEKEKRLLDIKNQLDSGLQNWRNYLVSGKENVFISIFSPDEKLIISQRPENRSDPILVQVVEEMGEEANGELAELKIVEIPDGIDYEINDYDGKESVHQKHQEWR